MTLLWHALGQEPKKVDGVHGQHEVIAVDFDLRFAIVASDRDSTPVILEASGGCLDEVDVVPHCQKVAFLRRPYAVGLATGEAFTATAAGLCPRLVDGYARSSDLHPKFGVAAKKLFNAI